MLPEDHSDERPKNGYSSPRRTECEVVEEDEDLVEIKRSYERKEKAEEEETLEVRVLVVKPDNDKRLVTCDAPLNCDIKDILIEVNKLLPGGKYNYTVYTPNVPDFGFDYLVEYYENDNDKTIEDMMRQLSKNYQIKASEGNVTMDDEVIEVAPDEASPTPDIVEIEEIREEDDVFIEKVILKHDLVDRSMEDEAGTDEITCEAMDVDVRQIKEEDVIPIESCETHIEEDSEIEEVPRRGSKYVSGSEGDDKEMEEVRATSTRCETYVEKASRSVKKYLSDSEDDDEQMEETQATSKQCETQIDEEDDIEEVLRRKYEKQCKTRIQRDANSPDFEYLTQINKAAKENVKVLFLTQMEEDEKKVEEEKWTDEEVKGSEREEEMEEDRMELEKHGESENENEMKEGEKVTDDVETVCIADDTLDEDETETSQSSGDKTILFIYPMSRGGITMTRDDYQCLNEYQFLNDIIIDFYLNYLMQEVLSQKDRDRTHLFSSHFYTRLTKLSCDDDSISSSLDERRYAGVQRWTKDVDIFQKDFIIVPINEHAHWFLAIICFPKLVDFVGYQDLDCEIEGAESQKPCILIFDSLGATKKTRVSVTLRGYLRHEYKAKMNETKEFNCSNLKAVYPKTPCQQNATDCGLFLLQYVESFFKDPVLDYTLPLKDLSDWFSHTVIERKRERIAKIIAMLAIKYNKTVQLPMLKLPKPKVLESLAKPSSSTSSSSSLMTRKCESNVKSKARFQPKKRPETRRIDVKRLKDLCDTDSDDATVPLTSKPKLRVLSHNPLPLRRSAYVPRSQVSSFYSFDDSDDLLPSAKASDNVSSACKNDAGSSRSSSRPAVQTYVGPSSKWKYFRERMESKRETEKEDLSNRSHEVTRSILNSGGNSADPFYNLSLEALANSSSIAPNTSFSQYKIKKKQNLSSNM